MKIVYCVLLFVSGVTFSADRNVEVQAARERSVRDLLNGSVDGWPQVNNDVLDLSGRNLKNLYRLSEVPNITRVRFLKLNDNELEDVCNDTFSVLPNIEYIDLSENRISCLGSNIFNYPINPRQKIHLNIAGNNLTKIADIDRLYDQLAAINDPEERNHKKAHFCEKLLDNISFAVLPAYLIVGYFIKKNPKLNSTLNVLRIMLHCMHLAKKIFVVTKQAIYLRKASFESFIELSSDLVLHGVMISNIINKRTVASVIKDYTRINFDNVKKNIWYCFFSLSLSYLLVQSTSEKIKSICMLPFFAFYISPS